MKVAIKTIKDPKHPELNVRLLLQQLSNGDWECELRYDGGYFYVRNSSLQNVVEQMRRELQDR